MLTINAGAFAKTQQHLTITDTESICLLYNCCAIELGSTCFYRMWFDFETLFPENSRGFHTTEGG